MIKHYFSKYPFSLLLVLLVLYLSFFTPPKTGLDEVTNIDKLVHVCMYGGLCSVVWIEYWRSHAASQIERVRLWMGTVVLPLLFSGGIELLQEYCTTDRSGDWEDMFANSIGVILAAGLGITLWRSFFFRH